MKKSILFLLALFSVTMTTQAAYYYRGEKNKSGNDWLAGIELTESTDGYYAYYSATAGAHQFKICTAADDWGATSYNCNFVTKNYNNTDIADIGDYGGDNCYTWTNVAHYIIVYYPNTKINATSNPIICASTFLPDDSETESQQVVYYYRGEKNKSGNDWLAGIELTESTDGYYAYYSATAGAHQFKICTAADDWGATSYNCNFVTKNYNNTDIADIGDYGGDNCYTWTNVAHYIIVYYPNTKINATSNPIICASTFLPDDSETDLPEPEPVADVTVHFINTPNWAEVACHHWIPNGAGTSWPGEVMTKETEQIAGYDVYTLTFTGEHPKCIFNNNKESGASQTGDLDVQDGKYYALSTQTWYDTKADAENALATPLPDETVYFVNNKSWTKVQVYGFEGSKGNADPAWPGTDITTNKTGEKVGEYDVYSFTAKQGEYAKIIFNNKEGDTGEQTNNLVWTNGKYYYMEAPTDYEGGTADEVKTAIDNLVTYDYYIADNGSLSGNADWSSKAIGLTDDNSDGVYEKTFTAQAAGTYLLKVTNGTWNDGYVWGFSAVEGAYEEVNAGESDNNIEITLTTATTFTVKFDSDTKEITFDGLTEKTVVKYDYYLIGTINGWATKDENFGMTDENADGVYEKEVTLAVGDNEIKVNNGTWDDGCHWGFGNLSAKYEGVEEGKDGEGNPNGNIKITLATQQTITVKFDKNTSKITLDGLTEKAPAEDVTVYFINSGNWAEVACYYWGGTDASTWPGVMMTANGEVYEAEGWNVYKVTFPGDNTSCIFNDNKAEGATQTGNLEVHDGQYYCYENGIWYERLADVDPLDTRVYLKGQMNEWCNNGYCDMFRKEDMSETVAYRTTWLDANTTYEFKIESAGAWLSCAQAVTKDNCTDLTFEEGGNNCTITTEYAGDYTFIWDMTTNKLSVVYPDPKANPSVLDLMVTNMVFDGDKTFSGTDNEYGIVFNLVVGEEIEEGVFALDASSTVDFGGTLFTEVTGTITPDMSMGMPTAATAVVYGFLDGMYFQLNVEMSAGGSAATPVEIWDGVATPNDGTGELTISATWEGDDVYVAVPGFDYTNYECPEVWFYIGGTTWETASIAAYGPATITVEDGGVLVEGTVISGITGTQYELMVFGLLPVEETPDYTRAVASGSYGTICLPSGSSKVEGAKFYEVTYKKDGYIYADEVTTLVAGMPYIFHATSTEIKVYYNETTATAGSNNGVYGTFSDITDGDAGTTGNVLEGKYLLVAGPKVQKCGGNCSLAANRAYFVVDEITTQEKQEIPGRQRIALGCQDENQATGLDNITENGAVAPALQGTYDILGRQLSEPAANGFYIINGKKMFVAK